MGLAFDGAGFGLGTRSQRYAAVIEDGTIVKLDVEPKPGVDVSSCENVLSQLCHDQHNTRMTVVRSGDDVARLGRTTISRTTF